MRDEMRVSTLWVIVAAIWFVLCVVWSLGAFSMLFGVALCWVFAKRGFLAGKHGVYRDR